MSKLPLLTADQDAEFDRLVLVWQARLNLQDWRIERGAGRAKGAMARVTTDYPARLATYQTGFWSGPTTSVAIEATVVHELMHVALRELTYLTSAEVAAAVLESAEHRVINTLEKLLVRANGA